MAHWKQILDKKQFIAFDYGSPELNKAHYNQTTPPVWNLTNIRVPVRLFAGSSDLLGDVKDVTYLWEQLAPEAKKFFKVYNSGHCTFVWGRDTKPWMTDIYAMLNESTEEENDSNNF